MPAQDVTRWAKRVEQDMAARDRAIVAMRAEGATLRAIATAAHMTAPGVLKVLKRAGQDVSSDNPDQLPL